MTNDGARRVMDLVPWWRLTPVWAMFLFGLPLGIAIGKWL